MKKIIFSLLILPLLFSLGSFFFSQKAHAFTRQVVIGSFKDTNNNAVYDRGNQLVPGPDSCISSISVEVIDGGPSTPKNTSCTGSGTIGFTTTQTILNVKANSSSRFNITGVWIKDAAHPNGAAFPGRTTIQVVNSAAFPNITVYFGLKEKPLPFCDENTTTNCQKCSSNSQCSSKANFKYCAPTTDRCSDLETYKTSVCRANNYCGTISLGSAGQVSCGGCGNGNSCNTNTNKCVTTPNCTTNAKLGACEPKANLPQPNGVSCGVTSGTQTRTFTDRPGYSTCKNTATTPQNCTPKASDVCRSGNCSAGVCAPASDPNQKTFSFTGYVFIDENGDGKKNGNDLFYKDPYIVKADSTKDSTLTEFAYDLKRTTNANEVNVRLTVPAGYVATKLNYQAFVGGTAVTATADGNSKTFSANNTINFGIKKPATDKCDSDAQCKSKNTAKPACKNANNESSVCVECTANNTSKCSSTEKCENNVCVPKSTGGGGTNPTPTCDKNAPTLEITPANRNGAPGTEKVYDVKVINNDKGSSCDPVTFVLSKERLPNTNWTGRFNDNTLNNIAKNGGSKSTQYHVKSPAGATDGPKTITIGVRRQGQTVAQKTVNVTYTVQDNTPAITSKAPTKKPTNAPPTTKPITDGPTPTVCQKSAPELSITPQTKSGNAGEQIIFNLKVKNTDKGPCDNRKFSFEGVAPSQEWDPNFSDQDITFAPGEEKAVNARVKSPLGTAPGTYNTVIWLLENNTRVSSIVAIYQVNDAQISPVPGKTYLNFKIGLDGIGTTPRIPIGGNKNPLNVNRGLNFRVYNASTNTLNFTGTNITFTYSQTSEKFELLYEFPSVENIPDGTYNIYVDGPRYLMNQYPGSVTITHGQVTNLTSDNFYLITGNINNSDLSANKLDLMDYNLLISCSIYSQDTSACDQDANYKTYADLDDDGIVNEDDYTLFLKELINQQGVALPN